MNRSEFILITAVILFVVFCLGWFANWVVNRFTRVSKSDVGELDKMAQSLHDAEEQRDQAIADLQRREVEMANELAQAQAELEGMTEGLRVARVEAAELRQFIEDHSQPK